MKKYYTNDKQYSKEEFTALLQDAIFEQAIEDSSKDATEIEVNKSYETMYKVALELLEENFEVYVCDNNFRVVEEN